MIDQVLPPAGFSVVMIIALVAVFVPSAQGASNLKNVLLAKAASQLESSGNTQTPSLESVLSGGDVLRLAAGNSTDVEKKNWIRTRVGLAIPGLNKHTKIF